MSDDRENVGSEVPIATSDVLRDLGRGLELVIARCPACDAVRYPARELCIHDLTTNEIVASSQRGTLYSAARVESPPFGFERPFWAGFVDLPEGVRLFAMIDAPAEEPLSTGQALAYRVGVVRTIPEPVLGPIFYPVSE